MKKGKWIAPPRAFGVAAAGFRTEFTAEKKIKKATLCASSMGNYALYLNGERVGKGVLTPGWTSYNHRVQYQTYDVTDLLKVNKKNRVEITVGQGWAVGYIGYPPAANCFYHDTVAANVWMEVLYADGTRDELRTDESWDVYTTEVTSTELYHGETVDKTAPIRRVGKAVLTKPKTKLIPQVGEWIVEQERFAPVEVLRTPKGELVIDFGQNLTGYVEMRIKGKRGDRVVMHHAEVLDKDGNFYNANFRSAKNENVYVLSGEEDLFKPTYTFQGFRYIRLTEYPFETADPKDFCAVAVYSEMKRTGRFACGNEKINQLYHNIVWGQRSNYLDVPTDCPQRDERLGWTGDAQMFFKTAAINFDVEKFFTKWLGDMALEQRADGAVMGIVPHCLKGHETRLSAAWGDAACIIPWQMYLSYGNLALLREHFPMMKKWVDFMHAAGPEEFLWLGEFHYGDWFAIDGNQNIGEGATPTDLVASAYFAHSTELLVRAGEALGMDMSEYRTLHANVVKAFRARYVRNGKLYPRANGNEDVLGKESQTAYILLLYFHLYEGEEERRSFAARLAELIREWGTAMSTGFVGTPYILHALSENGYTDLAYELLFREAYPSWLYTVCHGGTTMWEHWDGVKEDGSFWPNWANSFNHYAYGSVFDWIFGVSCGVKPTAPAYREVSVEPHPTRALGFADASIETRSGKIRAHWYYKGDAVYYEFEIPNGVTAHLTLPSGYKADLTGGIYHFAE